MGWNALSLSLFLPVPSSFFLTLKIHFLNQDKLGKRVNSPTQIFFPLIFPILLPKRQLTGLGKTMAVFIKYLKYTWAKRFYPKKTIPMTDFYNEQTRMRDIVDFLPIDSKFHIRI